MARKPSKTEEYEEYEKQEDHSERLLYSFVSNLIKKRRKANGEYGQSILFYVLFICVGLPLFIGAAYFVLFNPAVTADLPMLQPESVAVLEQAPQNQGQQAAEPEPVVLEPTLNPLLLAGNPAAVNVSVEAGTLNFKELITKHVQPADVGLIVGNSGNPVFDAVVTMTYAYGNTNEPEQMNAIMQNAGEFIKASANNGDPEANAFRQATFMQFRDSATRAVATIPGLNEAQILPTAKDIFYYTAGMFYLANNEGEYSETKVQVEQAGEAFKLRQTQIDAENAAAVAVSAEPVAIPVTEANPSGSPQNLEAAQPEPAPVNNPEPSTAREIFPSAETRMVAPDITAITLEAPTLTDYSKFPEAIAAPLKRYSGWSLNPEGVARVVQQFVALLNTGTAGAVEEWVVWSTYGTDTGFGKAWLFTLIEKDTLVSRWGELPIICQNYMGQLLENPARPEAGDIQQRWGLNACAEYLGGEVFNEGRNMIEFTYPSGVTEYLLHTGPDGKVDVMGAIWWGFGEDFPLKVGHTIKPRSFVNMGEGLIKGLLELLP